MNEFGKYFDLKSDKLSIAKQNWAGNFYHFIRLMYEKKGDKIINHIINCKKCNTLLDDNIKLVMLIFAKTGRQTHKHYHDEID